MIEFVLLSAAISLDLDADWRLLDRSAEITTYKLDITDTMHDAYRADGRVCAAQEDLFALFRNVEDFASWLPRTVSAERLEGDDFSQMIYVVSSAPWPMRPRDMAYRIDLGIGADGGSATVTVEGLPEQVPPRKGRARIKGATGLWQIALHDGGADLSFMLHLDLGRIPAVFSARSVHHAVRDALANLQARFPCADH